MQSRARDLAQYVEPSWEAPLDVASVLRIIPEATTVSGMFPEGVVAEARRRGITLPSARDQYLAFRFYPLRELARLLVEAAPLLHPGLTLRLALRKMGRAAPHILLESTIGKVVLGSVEGVHAILDTVSRTFPINLRPSRGEVIERGATHAVVRLSDVYYFLDCHHVGLLEGTLRLAGVSSSSVRIRPVSPGTMDYLCSWK